MEAPDQSSTSPSPTSPHQPPKPSPQRPGPSNKHHHHHDHTNKKPPPKRMPRPHKPPPKIHWLLRIIRSPYLLKLPCIFALTILIQCATHTVPAALLATLARCTAATLALQTAVGVPSALLGCELLFDLCGAGNFLVVVALSLGSVAGGGAGEGGGGGGEWWVGRVLGAIGRVVVKWDGGVWEEMGVDWRQGLVSAVVCVWAVRLGLFTFIRSLCRGGDSRFEPFRTQPGKFFLLFLMRGVWVTFCTLPIVALNSIPSGGFTGAGWLTSNDISFLTGLYRRCWFWLGLWSFFRGFMIECVADWELSKWRWDRYRKKHDEVFCGTGLWDKSRHPNYYGECLIWLGIAMSCSSVVISTAGRRALGLGWFAVVVWCSLTPYFVYKMLQNYSIKIIEERHDKLYMKRKDYRQWRRDRTFRLWLDGSGIFCGYI